MENIPITNQPGLAEPQQQVSANESSIPISNGRRSRLLDYPLFLSVKEVSEMTGLRTAACYTLLNIEGCPAFRSQGQAKYIIPRDAFYNFLVDLSQRPKNQDDMPYLRN